MFAGRFNTGVMDPVLRLDRETTRHVGDDIHARRDRQVLRGVGREAGTILNGGLR